MGSFGQWSLTRTVEGTSRVLRLVTVSAFGPGHFWKLLAILRHPEQAVLELNLYLGHGGVLGGH